MVSSAASTALLRGLSAASRFVLFIYMGRNLDPAVIGAYGLIAATIALVVQFVGFEFHYFNSRAMLAVPDSQRGRLIRDQLILHGITYLCVIPGVSLVFAAGLLEWRYAIYIFPLIIAEHLSQELFRVLVTCFRPVLATVLIFVRSGLWVYVFMALSRMSGGRGTVDEILIIWLVFSVASVALGGTGLYRYVKPDAWRQPIDWSWLRRGLRRSVPFLITTVCFTSLQFLDRFVLKMFLGEAEVGIFFFFASLSSFLYLLLTFGVGIFHGPKTIHAYQNSDFGAYRAERALLIKKYMQGIGILIVPAIFSIYIVLWWIGKPIYDQNVHIYWIMLAANIALIVADLINFDLYVRGRDSAIMWAAVIAMLCSVGLQFLFVPLYGIAGAAIATTLAYITLGTIRYAFLKYGAAATDVQMARVTP